MGQKAVFMKIAIIGSRNIKNINMKTYIPSYVTEIISGGAKGVDFLAKDYAIANNIRYLEILPDYKRYKKGAPLIRNIEIIESADEVIAFWDGISKGTKFVINECEKRNKKVTVYMIK